MKPKIHSIFSSKKPEATLYERVGLSTVSKIEFTPTNTNSLLCKMGRHKRKTHIQIRTGLGVRYDPAWDHCERCGKRTHRGLE